MRPHPRLRPRCGCGCRVCCGCASHSARSPGGLVEPRGRPRPWAGCATALIDRTPRTAPSVGSPGPP
eukprot:8104756-Lingulodinium_polyedra.AAC.1